MSKIVRQRIPAVEVAELTKYCIAKHGKEIEDLFKPAKMRMHWAMVAAEGADISKNCLREMVEHHRGAVALLDVVLANVATANLRANRIAVCRSCPAAERIE